jgi:hypothetical protein
MSKPFANALKDAPISASDRRTSRLRLPLGESFKGLRVLLIRSVVLSH